MFDILPLWNCEWYFDSIVFITRSTGIVYFNYQLTSRDNDNGKVFVNILILVL